VRLHPGQPHVAIDSLATKEDMMSHKPPREAKKKAQHTAKEKKAMKQQKKQDAQIPPFAVKH
jgi:hypothetical protein